MTVCPLEEQARRVLALEGELVGAMRKLRRSLQACAGCPEDERCPLWRELNTQVHQAVLEIVAEWDLH